MLKVKRRPNESNTGLETWLEWHKRSFHNVKQLLSLHNLNIEDKLQQLRLDWAGHIARMGLPGKPMHLLKLVVAWRCRSWEEEQRLFNQLNWDPIRHPTDLGIPRRWEDNFSTNWLSVLANL